MITIEHHLNQLNANLVEYTKVNTKTTAFDAMAKQMTKLSFALSKELKTISPPKGSLRSGGLERLASGAGVFVREKVKKAILAKFGGTGKGKGINLRREMVKRELSVRESGRGFLSVSARLNGQANVAKGIATSKDRFGHILSRAGITYEQDSTVMRVKWSGLISEESGEAAQGLAKAKGQEALLRALQEVNADMAAYIARKQSEALGKAISK